MQIGSGKNCEITGPGIPKESESEVKPVHIFEDEDLLFRFKYDKMQKLVKSNKAWI